MPSLTTIYRAIVIVAVGAIAVKGWHLYGPTNEQVKSAVVRAVEMAQTALQNRQESVDATTSDPRGAAPPFGNTAQSTGPGSAAPPPVAIGQTSVATISPGGISEPPALVAAEPDVPAAKTSLPSPMESERMPALMSQLEALGVAETNLVPWGNEGHLFRFTCRAPLASTPAMTQHFESVAAEPVVAVEQVVAKVEAWRIAQRNNGGLR